MRKLKIYLVEDNISFIFDELRESKGVSLVAFTKLLQLLVKEHMKMLMKSRNGRFTVTKTKLTRHEVKFFHKETNMFSSVDV